MGKDQFGSGPARFGRPPAPRPIVRAGLLDRLDAADGLVVIEAAAGAGKTTLLDAWSSRRGATMVELAAGGVLPAGGVLTADPAAVVVLDGVEALPAGSRWIADPPRGVRLVLSSRAALPLGSLPLGSPPALRLGDADLAFAEDETYQVLAAALGDAAAADALAPDLHLLTHGWPVLVGLAGAWLAQPSASPGPDERAGRLRSLARVTEPLLEHLVGAVLGGLDPDLRELVRRLAWLPAVDAALADRLDLTEDLAAAPPFVLPVGGKADWFAVPNPLQEAVRRELPLPAAEVAALTAVSTVARQPGM